MTSARLQHVVLVACAVLAPFLCSFAQSLDALNINDVASRASRFVNAKEYDQAVPYLERIIRELEPLMADNASARRAVDFAYFHLAVAAYEKEDYSGAILKLEQYLSKVPRGIYENTVRLMRVETYSLLQNWGKVETTAKELVADRDMNAESRMIGYQLLAQSYIERKQWEDALPVLQVMLDQPANDEQGMFARIQTAITLIELKKYDVLFAFLPSVRNTEAGMNIDLNVAMIEAADQRMSEKAFDQALRLYRWIKPRDELMRFAEKRVEQLQRAVDTFNQHGGLDVSRIAAQRQRLVGLLEQSKAEMEYVRQYPEYKIEVMMRIAQCYFELGRHWESYHIYRHLGDLATGSKDGEQALFAAFSVAEEMNRSDLSLEAGYAYLKEYPRGVHAEQVPIMVAQLEIAKERYEEAQDVIDASLRNNPNSHLVDYQRYLAAYCSFQLDELTDAAERFYSLTQDGIDLSTIVLSRYWHALCLLFLGENEKAAEAFTRFSENYPEHSMTEDARYRMGVARYGTGDLEQAELHLKDFLLLYPHSALAAEAWNLLGDLYAAAGQLDQAIAAYQKAADKTDDMVQITYATTQQARTYELEERWEDIIALFREYQNAHGESGRFTEAAYWIATAQRNLGRYSAAEETMMETIVQYGNDPHALGVDMIMRDIAYDVSQGARTDISSDWILRLYDEMSRAYKSKQRTLWLRLMALFSMIRPDDRSEFVGRMYRERYIDIAAPVSLVMMGQEAVRRGDDDFARTVFARFMDQFSDSELLVHALQGLAEIHLKNDSPEQAIPLLEDIVSRFATLPEAGWAQKSLGDALFKQGRWTEAEQAYQVVLAVREWRGELWPAALYGIGNCLYEKGDIREAFAYYQRVYVMYDGYLSWAAKAYLQSASCLKKLGKIQDAITTYHELLNREDMKNQPELTEARQALQQIGEI